MTHRAVSVGAARSMTRLARAVQAAATDEGCTPDVGAAIAKRTVALLRDDGYVITRQVGAA